MSSSLRAPMVACFLLFAAACRTQTAASQPLPPAPQEVPPPQAEAEAQDAGPTASPTATVETAAVCGDGKAMKVHFLDVEQALAVLVELPGGEAILVDTGDNRTKKALYERMLTRIDARVPSKRLSMLWITHQHSDHMGRAKELLKYYSIGVLAENGTDGKTKPPIIEMRAVAAGAGTRVEIVDPTRATVPLTVAAPVTLTAVVPGNWDLKDCNSEPNDCSIGLRIDYCDSSVLFIGDSETHEEAAFLGLKPVGLLQAPHHGSSTSSTAGLLAALQPKYVVISSGPRREGINKTYCHPERSAVTRLSGATGAVGAKKLWAFKDGTLKCKDSNKVTDADWEEVPVSDSVFSTARDGDVTLVTTGDGKFQRQ